MTRWLWFLALIVAAFLAFTAWDNIQYQKAYDEKRQKWNAEVLE